MLNMYYEDDRIQTYDQHLIENEIIVQHDVLKMLKFQLKPKLFLHKKMKAFN